MSLLLLLKPRHLAVHRYYVDYAQQLNERGDHIAAAVFSQTACEILVESVFSALFSIKNCQFLSAPLQDFISSYSLSNEKVRNLYNKLADDEIQKQAFWSGYLTAARQRHAAVHEGKPVSKEQATASIAAAQAFVAHLESVIQKLATTASPSSTNPQT